MLLLPRENLRRVGRILPLVWRQKLSVLEPLADLSPICVAQGRIFFRERSHARVTALVMRADVAADFNYAVEKKRDPRRQMHVHYA